MRQFSEYFMSSLVLFVLCRQLLLLLPQPELYSSGTQMVWYVGVCVCVEIKIIFVVCKYIGKHDIVRDICDETEMVWQLFSKFNRKCIEHENDDKKLLNWIKQDSTQMYTFCVFRLFFSRNIMEAHCEISKWWWCLVVFPNWNQLRCYFAYNNLTNLQHSYLLPFFDTNTYCTYKSFHWSIIWYDAKIWN